MYWSLALSKDKKSDGANAHGDVGLCGPGLLHVLHFWAGEGILPLEEPINDGPALSQSGPTGGIRSQ